MISKLIYPVLLLSIIAVIAVSPSLAAEATEEVLPATATVSRLIDPNWFVLASSVIGVFSAIATITPNTADNKIADFLLKLINILGANFGKARNDDFIE